ncbi:Sulfotransferase OS=Streptomyces fumanus OX=67302 GN=GCM10018772_33980 PE=4 SV=1 [Streptomyces fumanus]
MMPITFVVGTGRSGSTVLSHILNLHPDILSLNELLASLGPWAMPENPLTGEEFWRILVGPHMIYTKLLRSGIVPPEFLYPQRPGRYSAETGIPALSLMVLPHLTEDPDGLLDELEPQVSSWPHRPVAQHYQDLFALLAARFGRRVAVERSGYSLQWIPALRKAFPYAKFVHQFRDGPDCALSMSRHPGYRAMSFLHDILQRVGVSSPQELTPEHLVKLPPEMVEMLLSERFDPALVLDRQVPLAQFGDMWSQWIIEGVEYLSQVPDDARTTLAYEDMVRNPRAELVRLAEFIGVDPDDEWLEAGESLIESSRVGAALRLPPEQLSELRDSCAPGMRALRTA